MQAIDTIFQSPEDSTEAEFSKKYYLYGQEQKWKKSIDNMSDLDFLKRIRTVELRLEETARSQATLNEILQNKNWKSVGKLWVSDDLVTILRKLEYLLNTPGQILFNTNLHKLTLYLLPSQDDQRLDTGSRNEGDEREKFSKLILDKIAGRSVPIQYFQKCWEIDISSWLTDQIIPWVALEFQFNPASTCLFSERHNNAFWMDWLAGSVFHVPEKGEHFKEFPFCHLPHVGAKLPEYMVEHSFSVEIKSFKLDSTKKSEVTYSLSCLAFQPYEGVDPTKTPEQPYFNCSQILEQIITPLQNKFKDDPQGKFIEDVLGGFLCDKTPINQYLGDNKLIIPLYNYKLWQKQKKLAMEKFEVVERETFSADLLTKKKGIDKELKIKFNLAPPKDLMKKEPSLIKNKKKTVKNQIRGVNKEALAPERSNSSREETFTNRTKKTRKVKTILNNKVSKAKSQANHLYSIEEVNDPVMFLEEEKDEMLVQKKLKTGDSTSEVELHQGLLIESPKSISDDDDDALPLLLAQTHLTLKEEMDAEESTQKKSETGNAERDFKEATELPSDVDDTIGKFLETENAGSHYPTDGYLSPINFTDPIKRNHFFEQTQDSGPYGLRLPYSQKNIINPTIKACQSFSHQLLHDERYRTTPAPFREVCSWVISQLNSVLLKGTLAETPLNMTFQFSVNEKEKKTVLSEITVRGKDILDFHDSGLEVQSTTDASENISNESCNPDKYLF